jgi:hypothetical protein
MADAFALEPAIVRPGRSNGASWYRTDDLIVANDWQRHARITPVLRHARSRIAAPAFPCPVFHDPNFVEEIFARFLRAERTVSRAVVDSTYPPQCDGLSLVLGVFTLFSG